MKAFITFILIVIGGFCYATWNGITFWEDSVERNTEYHSTGHSHGGGYGSRFYHK